MQVMKMFLYIGCIVMKENNLRKSQKINKYQGYPDMTKWTWAWQIHILCPDTFSLTKMPQNASNFFLRINMANKFVFYSLLNYLQLNDIVTTNWNHLKAITIATNASIPLRPQIAHALEVIIVIIYLYNVIAVHSDLQDNSIFTTL